MKSERIDIRVTPAEKELIVHAAREEQVTISAWLVEVAMRAIATACGKRGRS